MRVKLDPRIDPQLYKEVVEYIISQQVCGVSMIQRHLRLGYSQSALIVDQMEKHGIVGPFTGMAPRKVLTKQVKWGD